MLMKNLEPSRLINHLKAKDVLETFDDKVNIENIKQPLMMSEKLLKILCEYYAFDEFLNALEKVVLEKGLPCMICLLRRAGKLWAGSPIL